jgi:7,8-dihydroneopterin aldolase/epimerase/oxygenase
MVTVELQNMLLQGHHGVYEEERRLANTFEVNLSVLYNEKGAKLQKLQDTVDYEILFSIVKEKMDKPGQLLEQIGQEVIHAIRKKYSFVREISISIYKLQVPIESFQGRAGVTLRRKYKN